MLFSPKNSPLFFSKNTICFADSSAKLVDKMKDMAICEKPSPSQVQYENGLHNYIFDPEQGMLLVRV